MNSIRKQRKRKCKLPSMFYELTLLSSTVKRIYIYIYILYDELYRKLVFLSGGIEIKYVSH